MNIIELFKNGRQIRKMQTAAGGPIINGGTPFSITVKGKDRRPAWKRMYLNPNLGDTSKYYNGNILEGVVGLTPGIGDAIDAVKASDAINNKDYTTAGFLGAGLLLPNIIEKPLKFARGLYKGYKANKMMKATRKAFDESGEKLEVDAFKSGSKPMYVTPAKGPGSDYIDTINDELKDSKYLDLERPFGKDKTLTLRYYINEDKLKQTIGTYKDFYKDRLGLYTNDVDKIYNHIISNPKLLDLNVNPGTTGLLDVIGVSLGYGPKDAILFKIGYNGLNMGEKVSKDAIEYMKTYGYDRTLPGIYNILKKNIERGTLGVKSTDTNGGHIGFGYVKNRLGGMLQLLKNGSGIHIKEKNKGSFTRWCGGNVTEECIRKGKASSNPKIRKKATFADNARKWKHEKGGCFKGYPSKAAYDVRLEEVAGFKKGGKAFVEGVNVLDSNPDAYKHVKKKVKMRLYGGPLEYLFKEAQYLKWVNDYLNPTVINHNPDIDANRNFKFNNSILQLTDEYNNLKLLEAEKINNEAQRYGSFLSKGLELLFGYLNKPKANNSTNFNTDSWSKVNKDLAGTSYIKPDTNNKLFTSNVIGSNMNVTYDDMRNLIMQ